MNDVEFVRELRQVGLSAPSESNCVLRVLGVENVEEAHSNFLAWLLRPGGVLEEPWLLEWFVDKTNMNVENPGRPHSVQRERGSSAGRYDIFVEWPEARLVIEYKVHTDEHDSQCSRYLEELGNDDALVYLSPKGGVPRSIEADGEHSSLTPMSYGELADFIIDSTETSGVRRGTVFARDYARSLLRISPYRMDTVTMDVNEEPDVAEGTEFLFSEGDRFEKIREQAVEDTWEIIEWTVVRSRDAIGEVLGRDVNIETDTRFSLIRPPGWESAGYRYGLCLEWGRKKSNLRPLPNEGFNLGIRIEELENADPSLEQNEFSKEVQERLQRHWPGSKSVGRCDLPESLESLNRNAIWPLGFRESVALADGESWREWSDGVVEAMEELADEFGEVLDRMSGMTDRMNG